MGLRPFSCTYSYPYSPECVEEEFCEVGLRVYGVLRSSSLESPRRLVRARDYSGESASSQLLFRLRPCSANTRPVEYSYHPPLGRGFRAPAFILKLAALYLHSLVVRP